MKEMLKEAAILFVITLLSGCLLGLVYEVTKEPIADARAREKEEACKEVFADAESFAVREDLTKETAAPIMEEGDFNVDIEEVSEAYGANGALLGYVLIVTDHEGYGGDIQFSIGIRNDGRVNGISFLDISETAGLGMKADPVLKEQFVDRQAEQFVYTKSEVISPDQIQAISGATITTNGVVNGVNAGLTYFRTVLQEGGSVNE